MGKKFKSYLLFIVYHFSAGIFKWTGSLYSDQTGSTRRDQYETGPITTAVRGDHPLLHYLSCVVHQLNYIFNISNWQTPIRHIGTLRTQPTNMVCLLHIKQLLTWRHCTTRSWPTDSEITWSCASSVIQGRFQKKIKGSSFMGVAATPLKPLPSCYRVKRRRD